MDAQVAAQVARNVERVRGVHRQSIAAVEGKFLGGAPAQRTADALRGLSARIDNWAKSGTDAAASDTSPVSIVSGMAPVTIGWGAWAKSGDALVAGINALTGYGLTANVESIKQSATEIPADAKRAAKATARVIADATDAASNAVGGAAANILRPFILPLALIAAGLVAVAVVKSRAA